MADPKQILKQYFGFNDFRGKQRQIIERVLSGGHSLVIMPTGSGKSLTYQVPALIFDGLTVVISPLIALMKDQVDVLHSRKIDAAFVNSSLGKKERLERYQNISEGKYKLLYVTPERFRKKEFLDVLKNRKISLLAIDEAHCISEWGHDFRPDYTRLTEFRQIMGNPLTMALTATATKTVQEDIISQLNLVPNEVRVFNEGIERENLFLKTGLVWGEKEKLEEILKTISAHPGNGIIYFVLIKDLRNFSELLTKNKIRHLVYHGDLESAQRKKIQNRFMQGQNNIVLATNAFGMGVDKDNIRFVIHAQIPGSLESYYQEIGRAGRDGKPSLCYLLYDEQDLNIQLEFIKWNNPTAGFYDRLHRLLQSDPDRVNGEGIDFLREQMTYKNRNDFRLETALGMFDRWAVTEGSIENKNLQLTGMLPEHLTDQPFLDQKIKNEQNKLYQMVLYAKTEDCRKDFIHRYFDVDHISPCGACDNDLR